MSNCLLIAALAFLSGIHVAAFSERNVNSATQVSEKQSKPLAMHLVQLGQKYDCFFTIEGAFEEGQSLNEMESQSIAKPSGMSRLELELEYFRQTIPHFAYEIDRANPRIVHIVDARLAQRQGYGLESTINIDFKGTVKDLIKTIGNLGVSILPEREGSFTEFYDSQTSVQVKGEELKVRDALSNFFPLAGRVERILWVARTKLGQEPMTYVHYVWPGKNS